MSEIFLDIALILIAARLLGEISIRVGVPSVIGELTAGIVLGPSLLGWVTPNEVIILLAEIGIMLLLFEAGLDSDFKRLARAGMQAFNVAIVGFVAPFLLGFFSAYVLFSLPLLTSLFIGGTLTATSIGVTIRILKDIGRQNHMEGQVVIGAAVVDDIMGVIVLAVLYEFATQGEVSLDNGIRIIFFVVLFFMIAPLIAKFLSFLISKYRSNSRIPGLIPVALISLVLLMASAAHALGVPELLGGFVAGIALSRRFVLPFAASLNMDAQFTDAVKQQISPIVQLFTPIFFVMVGLSLDLSAVDWGASFFWMFSIWMTALAIVGKLLGGLLAKGNNHEKVAVGMAMVPRGEMALVFAELGRVAGVFELPVYTALVVVIAYTTLFAPFWMKLFYRRYGHRFKQTEVPKEGEG